MTEWGTENTSEKSSSVFEDARITDIEDVEDTNPKLYMQRTIKALNEQRYEDALQEAKKAVTYGNGELVYHVLIVRVLMNMERYPVCLKYLVKSGVWGKRDDDSLLPDEKKYIRYAYRVCCQKCGYPIPDDLYENVNTNTNNSNSIKENDLNFFEKYSFTRLSIIAFVIIMIVYAEIESGKYGIGFLIFVGIPFYMFIFWLISLLARNSLKLCRLVGTLIALSPLGLFFEANITMDNIVSVVFSIVMVTAISIYCIFFLDYGKMIKGIGKVMLRLLKK